jgi:hypothetical protein
MGRMIWLLIFSSRTHRDMQRRLNTLGDWNQRRYVHIVNRVIKHLSLLSSKAYPNLRKYARVLLGHCPQETTKLFIDYHSGNYRPEKEDLTEAVIYNIPKPRTAFSSFVDHPDEFMTFLEALIAHELLKKEDKIDLYTTLFEMYLDTANRQKDVGERQEWETKAKKLIEGKDVSDRAIRGRRKGAKG